MKTLSIIVPCYYEEESLPLFYKATEEVNQQLENIKFEYRVNRWNLSRNAQIKQA